MLKPGFRERFMRCVHKLDAGNVGKPLGQDVVSILNRRCVGFLNQRDVKVIIMILKNLASLLDS